MRIFFSAGEPSGDQHTAKLIEELRKSSPDFQAEGFGGPAMRAVGCNLLFELTDLAVMGFLRVLPLIAKFRAVVKQAEKYFDENPPDAVVLVDFPGFNWWIARAAKNRGIPVYYYLPPQLWAWAPWRIRKVRKFVDHVLCALPFEYQWYKDRGVKCTWVGHPFFDQVARKKLDQGLVDKLRGSGRTPVVALLPGSRGHEIEKNWPVMMQVVRNVASEVPDVRWIVGSYRENQKLRCQELEQSSSLPVPLHYFVDSTSEVIAAADCCFMVSGSISLELLARRKAGIVLYRVPTIGRFFSRFLMMCRFISLPNLMADDEIMPEFISNGSPDKDIARMTERLLDWLKTPGALAQATAKMSQLAESAANPGATKHVAEFLESELGSHEPAGQERAMNPESRAA